MNQRILIVGALAVATSVGCKSSTGPRLPLSATLSPPSGTIGRCNSVQMSVSLLDREGAPVTADSIHWRSSDSSIASVSATGVVKALNNSEGVTITATEFAYGSSASAQATFNINSTGPASSPCA